MLSNDTQKLQPGNQIHLYELYLNDSDGEILRFHGHMQDESIWWQGLEYKPMGIEISGTGVRSDGRQDTPSLTIANCIDGIVGAVSALCIEYDDFKGIKIKIHNTLAAYLDPINFPDGINENTSDEEDVSIWYVEQKTSENAKQLEFELTTPANVEGQLTPGRQITPLCEWACKNGYRGESCGYTGTLMFDEFGEPTDDPALDRCGARLSDCRKRFGDDVKLPFGGFPAAGLID